ncbi:tyrosine-type recombinase/integrase [Pseudomonas sp. K1(2024)]|uniref:Tyrosine-type recombinase/integrase n=1 Tax=Pseudomonas boreofloridensis TaxID=3064348 RepID=A0ABV4Z2T4_9PSED|nr:tyrosine-type recombinase/integrase [Pseudomonas sp. K13]MDO7900650.1 tyrosine-type recombinase/integrase [Pseudomonas sp. K13]
MATIRLRKKADGTTSYTVQIRINRDKVTVYQESQTFARKQAAVAWAKRRETELSEPGAIERANRVGHPIKAMIDRYLIEAEKARPLGVTKRQTLKAIQKTYLAEIVDSNITQQVLVDYALWRMSPDGGGVQPQTAGNDLAHLGSVLSLARAAWGYQIDARAMPDARLVLKQFGYNMRSRERDRRPTMDELDKVLEHFFEMLKRRPTAIHMPKVVAFAIFSTRRMDEITRILWEDLDEHRQAVKVRDMKNPGQKIGNDVWCHLPNEAWLIVQSMPRECREIFPYNADSIGTAWSKTCKIKGIEDLHFHDLRHEGVSRLFEMDWDIPRVSSVSGHRDWNSLRRYTHLRGRGDVYRGWKWLDPIIQAPVKLGARAV